MVNLARQLTRMRDEMAAAPQAWLLLLFPLVLLLLARSFSLARWFRANGGARDRRRKQPDDDAAAAAHRLPPSPPALPVLGHLHLVGSLPHVSLRNLARKHGMDLMFLRLGAMPVLVASSPRAAEAVLRTHDHVFATRPQSLVAEVIMYGPSDVGFAPYGDYWRRVRKLVTTHLLSVRKVQSFRRAREEEVARAMAKVGEAAAAGAAVDVGDLLSSFTNDLACRAVMGDSDSFHADSRNRLFRELVADTSPLLGGFNIEEFFPFLARFGVLSKVVRAKSERLRRRWDELLEPLIDEHERQYDAEAAAGSNPKGHDDFIHVLLSVREEYGLTREQMKALLLDVFFAGIETSAAVLEFTIAELMRRPRETGGLGGCCGGGGGCALLAAVLVVSALVIHGGGGLKQSHAPAVARKVLLSITSWHPQNNLDNVLHPSPVQDQRFKRVGTAAPPVSTASPPISIGQQMKRQAASTETTVHPANYGKNHGIPVAAPSKGHHHSMPVINTHGKTHGPPVVVPAKRKHHHAPANGEGPGISPSKSPIAHRKRHGHGNSNLHHSPAPAPVHLPPSKGRGQGNSAYAPHHPHQYHSPSYSPGPSQSPVHPPETPVFKKPKALAPTPNQPLLSPPTNSYCTASCQDPLTNSPPGTTCLCVLPIKVELRFGIALYTFFTLVAEFAQDIASGVLMNQSQVRVMGANAAPDDPEKTIVFVDLLPLEPKFDNTTALLVFERFWHNKVIINPMHFGKYDVLYVQYEGLPPSPPASMNNGLSNANGQPLHPLAVDVGNHRERKGRGIIVIIILSSVFAFILCAGAALVVYFKLKNHSHLTEASLVPTKPAGPGSAMAGNRLESRPISASPSFSSSLVAYKGSAKAFSLVEMERATQVFDESRIIGEGGFGRVYEGIFEDGERVAIKVLKRDDQQGTREFLAEVEMLSRLHHRNLVKLIGICTEGHSRCLVYELVPNGSVESHLHGSDKGASRLDWDARLKIALGAARALAYLHEDSSPRVIHRDFKSSNILLEHDFTPKVSDFGLARTALGEGNEHISTRVMGTFGYVAPEYAMTGHLLVKSDVYSYGVVLLELLTGRKPVDMSRPPGQENLVAWASSLLTSRDGLESIIDPSLGSSIPFDSMSKVAAIASMCVQPEVDQRPFMGEVVQALKLVCNEGSEFNGSTSFSQDLHIQDVQIMSRASMDMDVDPALSAELFTSSAHYDAIDASGSFRRYSSSGPLRVGRAGHSKERGLSTGSSSEHVGYKDLGLIQSSACRLQAAHEM